MRIDKLSEKQAQVFRFIESDGYCIICDGAVRSGKTVIMTAAFVIWAMEYFDHTNFAICAKTVQSAERNILRPFLRLGGLPYTVEYKLSNSLMILRCGGKENYFYFFGGKDESSYMLIQGITLAGVFFDEAALQPRSFVEQAIARTLTFSNAKLWFNCNPEGPDHWFYKEWIAKAAERGVCRIHFLMEDNPVLSEQEIQKAAALFSGVFYERYILGKWVGAEGLIYRNFADEPGTFNIEKEQLPAFHTVNIGVDFGGNKSNHAFCAVGITDGGGAVIALRSESIPAADTSVDDIIRLFSEFAAQVERDFGRVSAVFCDSAEQAIINTMRARTKYNIRNSIKNRIIDRIRAENILLSSHRFSLVQGENDALINGLANAVWDADAAGDVRLDNGSSDIDILDAFEYAWEYYIKQIIRY
ncbi:MAG TPA: PBSX family phage terminase large subunit [Candidatus Avimonoglobus intestinipullorum]|uniref:PBSX family phage terminase large subunit n=1 Tax=Candidatus Avimonoglobus intestinipullorum TaxID=2840699 RepID=A0A9D1LUG6_9FIRM|nr:PBSX family phage terminase large subunit [Candidatus Avimonoglobus intestinipullorum]